MAWDMLATTVKAGASPAVRGALWMATSCVFFAIMTGFIRYVTGSLDPLIVVFFRNLFGLLVMLPWLSRSGLGVLRTQRLPLYSVRALIWLCAMTSWYMAISAMNLADAVALSFTTPLFATVVAVLVLGEVVRLRRWSAVAIGFVGAMIILRPGFEEITPGAFLVLASAGFMAVGVVVIKLLSRTEKPAAIVFYMVLFLTPASLVPALFVWQTPTPTEFFWLAGIGAVGTLGHLSMTRAYSIADATAVLPFDFLRLPVVAVIGYVAFGEVLDIWTGIGATIIIASSVYIAHREALHERRLTVPPVRPDGVVATGAR